MTTGSGKLNWQNHKAFTLISVVFAIDCILESLYKFWGDADTLEKWYQLVQIYSTSRSFFSLAPYVLILYLSTAKIRFDWIDKSLAVTCFIFTLINASDFFISDGYRNMYLDWAVFGFIYLILVVLKLKMYSRK